MSRLAGKTAVITGGDGGIGLATAQLFAAEGAKVLLVAHSEAGLQQSVQSIGAQAASYAVADVSQPDQVGAYVQTAVERYGGIDIFISNAGIEGVVTPLADYPLDDFDKVMAVNVRGAWLGLKYVIPVMQKRGGGSIIITSSIAGIKGQAGMSAYVTSKHAELGLMRTAALECAPIGIRVNAVNPGPIEDRMMHSLEQGFAPGAADAAKQAIVALIPMKRYGTTGEVAQLMLFLASDDSRYCTGGVYMVDGGVSAL
ncbi:MAG TPA: SDR family NAD(P)-dependent oxidoreductase [Blastocatellia bacterium]|nr:SDR family NAD(P)-dependent oxidoreductase [Blastocatellia bacterium]